MFMGNSAYCLNCQALLNAVADSFLSMQYLHDTIRRRNLPFVPNLYSLLGGAVNLKDGMQNFADLVLEGKNIFEEYNALAIQMAFEDSVNQTIEFKDNFFDWIDLKIPTSEVVFKPLTIIHQTTTYTNYPSVKSSDKWSYDNLSGIFWTVFSTYRLQYYAAYPMRAKFDATNTQTPVWTAESGVYLVQDADYFIDQVSLCVMRRIQEYSNFITLEGFSKINLADTIKRLEERCEENRSKSSNLYLKWRNK